MMIELSNVAGSIEAVKAMITNQDVLVAGTTVLFAITVAWLIVMLRERHAHRMAMLDLAGEHLDAHFDALERVLRSDKVSKTSKDLLREMSFGLGQRKFAERIALKLVDHKRNGTKPSRHDQTAAFLAEVERLEETHPDIVEDIASVLHFAKSAMLLRFPFCHAAYRMLERPEAIRLARRPVSEIKKTSAILSDAAASEAVPA